MFENLTGRLNKIFNDLRRRGKLSEADVDASLKEVRLALLEADVHYTVAKKLVNQIRERAIGHEVSKALNPAQQVIKIVHEELISTLGAPEPLNLSGEKPRVIILAGLQGSGKTTAAAKLGKILRSQGERVLLVAADPYRPAAVKQLQTLGEKIGVEVFSLPEALPPKIVKEALSKAEKGGVTVMIIDTAGRSQLDDSLMKELTEIQKQVKANDVLLVIDSMIGQEALQIANGFKEAITLTGLILTKMDGDSRGGAAISIRSVTGVPIKFIGTGEGIDALEKYDPSRLASRILGMGDMIGLIEKAEQAFSKEDAEDQASRMMSGKFTLEDFSSQLKQIRKMGPIQQLLDLLPGNMSQLSSKLSSDDAEQQIKRTEAIINSMTLAERKNPDILNASRRRRIARGSGSEVQDVNRLIKQFREAQKLFKTIQSTGGRGLPRLFR